MKEEIKLLDYVYKDGVNITMPGSLLYALLQVLDQVKEDQTHYVFNHYYDKTVKEIKDLSGVLEKIETIREQYPSATTFFGQTPQVATTTLGCAAMDLTMLLKNIHLQEIEKGNALQVGTVIPPQNVKQ